MRRWLLWTFHCRRGRRCAKLEIAPAEPGWPPLPPGLELRLYYTCGGCGTRYRMREQLPA